MIVMRRIEIAETGKQITYYIKIIDSENRSHILYKKMQVIRFELLSMKYALWR